MARKQNRLTDFGKTVVKALIEQDMTKTELAAQIGTSPEYLSYILHGVRSGEKYFAPIVAALDLDYRQSNQL
ncbi:XRE family transcriptional regulator [Clostridiaceae bacterium]|nr:XRE family transcriptional regulator [Clostridiaceae bacterium]